MLTIKEYAEKVGVSEPTVRFWLKNEQLKKRKFSGILYFTQEDVEKAPMIIEVMKKRKIKGMQWQKK